ncbi:MAG TPA: hypothetical protein VK926_03160 [Gaiellaceae bacterium]|nr:hypothetical protein [Gaiellaceae bacterium]
MKGRRTLAVVGLASMVLAATFALAKPAPSGALIHEIIAAACRAGGEEVVPPGQAGASKGNSFVRALQATGVISSIELTPTLVTVNFDLSKMPSKYMAGPVITIPDGFGPGVDLKLNPLPVLDPSFPAHANCKNLQP